jgi:hypothetical protein
MHAIQAWVALPDEAEESTPTFSHHEGHDLPVHSAEGVSLRLLAGEAFGLRAAVRTLSPLFYLHAVLEPGAKVAMPGGYAEHGAYVVSGSIHSEGIQVAPGQMWVGGGAGATLTASARSVVMLLGGEPVGPRFIEWNFVASSQARIDQAKADWRAGRMKLPDADNREFIPLPPDPPPGANAMS